MLLFFHKKLQISSTRALTVCFEFVRMGEWFHFVSLTVFQPLCTVFDSDRSFRFRGLKLVLKTLSSFGEEGIKPVEIKETWRIKCPLLNVERPFHGKLT